MRALGVALGHELRGRHGARSSPRRPDHRIGVEFARAEGRRVSGLSSQAMNIDLGTV